MYRLQILRADVWSILDERDDEVFQGTLTDCESWLDSQENRSPSVKPDAAGRSGLRDWFRQWWKPQRPLTPLTAHSAANRISQRP